MRSLLLVGCMLAMGGTARADDVTTMLQNQMNDVIRRRTPEEDKAVEAFYAAKRAEEARLAKDAHTRLSKRAAHSMRPRMLSRRTNRAAMAAQKAARVPAVESKKVQPPQQPPRTGAPPTAR